MEAKPQRYQLLAARAFQYQRIVSKYAIQNTYNKLSKCFLIKTTLEINPDETRFVEFVACIINIHIFTIFANTIAHCPMPIARAHCCPPQTHLVSSINYIRYKIIHFAQFFALLTILFKKPVRVHQGYMNSCGRE